MYHFEGWKPYLEAILFSKWHKNITEKKKLNTWEVTILFSLRKISVFDLIF